MEKELRELINKWLLKANNDLMMIENEFHSENPVTDGICFHAQQSVEKYLKAFLVANQIEFPQTHNIGVILNLCIKVDPDFQGLRESVTLTRYATGFRYPDDFYIPSIEEANKSFEIAKMIKKFVLEKLKRYYSLID